MSSRNTPGDAPAVLVFRKVETSVPAGQSLGAAIRQIGLEPETVLAMRSGELIQAEAVVQAGDRIKLISVISGG